MSSAVPPTSALAPELRRRAQALRRLGRQLASTPATTLALRAGPDVWTGPVAQQCTDDLAALTRALSAAAEQATLRALRLEAEADRLEAAARATLRG